MAERKLDTEVKKASEVLEKALSARFEAGRGILQQGTKLIVPQAMSLQDAVDALTTYIAEMEEMVEKNVEMYCHVDDGLYAFYQAMTTQFGQILGKSTYSFFGKIPAQERSVTIGFNKTATIPVEHIQIPGLTNKIRIYLGHRINRDDPMNSLVVANFEYIKKWEPLIEDIQKEWKRILDYESIFKGKAVTSNWEFVNTMAADTSKLVYSESEQAALNANLFMPMRQTSRLFEIDEPVRRTILLHGKFGTGKTFTALRAAQIAEENGWTFINVLPGHDITVALNFAKKFQPAVVFFEDVDQATDGGRSEALNMVLNTVDGLLSKDANVITILTTNNQERINRAMLRPGRIDAVLQLGVLDEPAVIRLVEVYAGKLLKGKLDGPALFKAASGYVPAFVAESVRRAKRYALARDPEGQISITSKDVENALVELRSQWDLMHSDQVKDATTLDSLFREVMEDVNAEYGEVVADEIEERVLKRLKCMGGG